MNTFSYIYKAIFRSSNIRTSYQYCGVSGERSWATSPLLRAASYANLPRKLRCDGTTDINALYGPHQHRSTFIATTSASSGNLGCLTYVLIARGSIRRTVERTIFECGKDTLRVYSISGRTVSLRCQDILVLSSLASLHQRRQSLLQTLTST